MVPFFGNSFVNMLGHDVLVKDVSFCDFPWTMTGQKSCLLFEDASKRLVRW